MMGLITGLFVEINFGNGGNCLLSGKTPFLAERAQIRLG